MIQLRPTRANDQPTIRAMIFEARLDPSSLHWQHFTVAERGSQIVGIAQIKPYADCREFGSFVVHRAWRKHGVGKLLIENVLAREMGDVYLVCNSPMMAYYRKFNFEQIGFGDAPRTLKLKLAAAFLLRLFGVRIVAMKRDARPSA